MSAPGRTRAVGGLAFAVLAALTPACKRPSRVRTRDVAAVAPPSDHLAAGEVAAGNEKAFALALPRASHVIGRYATSVLVRSPLEPEVISNFIQARVKSGKRIVGATSTTFESVVVPSEPNRQLMIEIRLIGTIGDRTSIVIEDVTGAAPAAIPTDEAWRRAGRSPDGKLIDPSKVE